MSFTLKVVDHTNIAEILVSGSGVAPQDFDELFALSNELIQQKKVNQILNLAEVKVLNSIGLNALIKILTKTRNAGGDLTIVNISDKIKQVLLLTKLNTVLNIATSIDEAIESFN
jgi:anti-sigma B factor antagonist